MNSNSNFLLIVDLDGIVTRIPDGLLKELLEEEGDWAALFANQSGPYYDLAALRHQHWNPEDPFMYQDFLLSVGYKRRAAAKKAIVEKMLLIQSSAPRIRVDSAFGGMAIYRLSHLPTSSRYKGIVDGQQVCEHVPLNSSLSAINLGLYIEPKLIIAKYTEHTYQLSKFNRLLANLLAIFVMPLGEDKFESAVIRLAKIHQRLLR
jgi:hypothetical protein